jgi:glucosamine--fructose-6-phosphate aminotransferase (isomerizing)
MVSAARRWCKTALSKTIGNCGKLKAKGHQFRSDTDTEVIPHLIAEHLKLAHPGRDQNPWCKRPVSSAVRAAVSRLEGAFALAVINADYPDDLIVVRQQAPLVIGFGQGEFFCASDTPAIVPHTRAVLPLENGELARLTPWGWRCTPLAAIASKSIPSP